MTYCSFQLNADGLYQCPTCGWIYPRKSDKAPRRNCHALKAPPTAEQIAEQIAERARQQAEAHDAGTALGWKPAHITRWAGALTRWIAAGRPTRDDDEVGVILITCEACTHYRAAERRCGVCGCMVSSGGMAIFNKARLSTERCPKDKW